MSVAIKRQVQANKASHKLFTRVLIWKAQQANPTLSCPEIAQLLDKPEWTVRRVMHQRKYAPAELLEALEIDAVKAWAIAIPVASRKGDHRPAKDLLLHTKAIAPVVSQVNTGVTVTIGVLAIPGLSRLERDGIELIANDLPTINQNVTETLNSSTTASAGADSRGGDPPAGSG